MRSYHKLSGLKQHTLIISKFLWLGICTWLSWILQFRDSHKAAIKALNRTEFSLEDSTNLTYMDIVRIQFLQGCRTEVFLSFCQVELPNLATCFIKAGKGKLRVYQ